MNPERIKLVEPPYISSITSHFNKRISRGSWRISKNLRKSFYYAIQGITYCFLSQRNFRIQIVLGAVALSLGLWLELNLEKLAIIVFTIASVLILELINTAIESVVDLAIGRRFHPLARIAKDCAAGAALIAAFCSLIVGLILLLPALLTQLGA
tara:strand:+ start:49861 stop:50322 length:462 start_codon:yes stop_codon:yes gene_type:complete